MKSKLILLLLSALGRDKPKRETSDRGFTLIEVIVAMVILSIFIVASLSALVTGLNLKLKAKLNNEATLLIQQDLELVRYVAVSANNPTVGSTLPTASIASSVITVVLPIVLADGKNTLFNSSANASLKAGTETLGYTLAAKPALITTPSVSVKVDVTKTVKTIKLFAASTTASITVSASDVSKFAVGQSVLISSSTSALVGKISTIASTTITLVDGNNASLNVSGYPTDTPVTILPSSGETIADPSVCPSSTSSNRDTIATSSMAYLSSVSLASTSPPLPAVSPNPVVSGSTTVSQVSFNSRNYQIRRTATNPSNFRVQLDYEVIDKAVPSSPILASLKTEVIPSVANKCS